MSKYRTLIAKAANNEPLTDQEQGLFDRVQYWRLPKVVEYTGKPKSTIYGEMSAGKFPNPVKIGERSQAWVNLEVMDHMAKTVSSSYLEAA